MPKAIFNNFAASPTWPDTALHVIGLWWLAAPAGSMRILLHTITAVFGKASVPTLLDKRASGIWHALKKVWPVDQEILFLSSSLVWLHLEYSISTAQKALLYPRYSCWIWQLQIMAVYFQLCLAEVRACSGALVLRDLPSNDSISTYIKNTPCFWYSNH